MFVMKMIIFSLFSEPTGFGFSTHGSVVPLLRGTWCHLCMYCPLVVITTITGTYVIEAFVFSSTHRDETNRQKAVEVNHR